MCGFFQPKIQFGKTCRQKALKSKPLKKEQCTECDVTFEEKCDLENHIKMNHPKLFKCQFCSTVFEIKSHLKHHFKRNHPNMKTYKCKHCNKIFEKTKLKIRINQNHQNN